MTAAVVASAVLSLSAHTAVDAQPAAPEVMTVELSSFKFTPSALTLEHGRTYRLHLVNVSGGGHDFMAPEFFAASEIVPADRGEVTGGKVRLAGRQSANIVLTPEKPGTYELHCSHFLHASVGDEPLNLLFVHLSPVHERSSDILVDGAAATNAGGIASRRSYEGCSFGAVLRDWGCEAPTLASEGPE